jgi:hypothetical protein
MSVHHHQITKLSHSINAIGPAPHRGGRKYPGHCMLVQSNWPACVAVLMLHCSIASLLYY